MPNACVLVVDDEKNILSTLSRALRIEDFDVDVAGNATIAIEKVAARLGLSRNEYLKRTIAQEAGRGDSVAGISDLRRFGELSADLLDEDVMRRAWS